MGDACETVSGYILLIPVYNDLPALECLIAQLDTVLQGKGIQAQLVVVDDGSHIAITPQIPSQGLKSFSSIEVVRLRGNMGHQRAIAIGLAYIHEHMPGTALIIMDGDGEDRPEDVVRLIERFETAGGEHVIFAARMRRSENLAFTCCYHLYRLIHYILTGIPVRVGNFSIVPYPQLERLVVTPDLWNHYAAAVFCAGLPRDTLPAERGQRFAGHSAMSFTKLVMHGLSAISVFSATAGVRLLLASCGLTIAVGGLLLVLLGLGLGTESRFPGMLANAAGVLLVLLSQGVFFSFALVISLLSTRNRMGFLPIRDYSHFIQWVRRVYPPDA